MADLVRIKVKHSGLETEVTPEYFEKHKNEGWFIEIPKPAPVVKKSAPPKRNAKKE